MSKLSKKIKDRIELYLKNKSAKVKESIVCPICLTNFIKKQHSQAFCCSSCKDKYWNDKKDRHSPNYYHKYNKKHPERILRMLPTLTARDIDEYDAMNEYLTNEEFRNYVDEGALFNDGASVHVELSTELANFYGWDD